MKTIKTFLRLRSFDKDLLNHAVKNLSKNHLSIDKRNKRTKRKKIRVIPLPTKRKRFTFLRSPHVNKTSREQFEIKTHTRLIKIESTKKSSNLSSFQSNCLPGISLKVVYMTSLN